MHQLSSYSLVAAVGSFPRNSDSSGTTGGAVLQKGAAKLYMDQMIDAGMFELSEAFWMGGGFRFFINAIRQSY
jgi:hypothetical protein